MCTDLGSRHYVASSASTSGNSAVVDIPGLLDEIDGTYLYMCTSSAHMCLNCQLKNEIKLVTVIAGCVGGYMCLLGG